MKKISILHENMQTCKPEDYYTEVITAPPSRKVTLQKKKNAIKTTVTVILFTDGF